jgi:hypothetical protein
MHLVRQYHETRQAQLPVDERNAFPLEPAESTVQCAFVDSNPYNGNTLLGGRIRIKRKIQKRSAHADHIDTHYCHDQRRILN